MGDFNFLSSKMLDPVATDVLSVLKASLHDQSALLSTVNSVVNHFSILMVSSPTSEKAELDRLRLMLKIKHHLETKSALNEDFHKTADDGARYKSLATHCVAALHELGWSNSGNATESFTTICDILGLCLLIMPSLLNSEIVNSIINHFDDDHQDFDLLCGTYGGNRKLVGAKAMAHLKVLETLINVSVILKERYLDQSRLDNEFKDATDKIDTFLLNIISFGEKILATQTLLSIVPKIIALAESNAILVKIWGHLAIFDGFEIVIELPRVILVLVSLADYFLALTPSAISLALSADTKFWRILALGLGSDDALLRKQALYIAKRADAGDTDKAVTGGDTAARRSLWSRFLVVLETLEETQAHLALAVLPRADRLLPSTASADSTRLTQTFALVLFRRLLRHDQPGVVKWGILRFMRSDVNALCKESSETDAASILCLAMSTLNSAFMFAPGVEGGGVTRDAIAALASRLPSATFSQLLRALATQAWNPCALLHVAHALALADPRHVLHNEDLQLVCSLLTSALSTSGACVRAAVQCSFLSMLINLSDPASLGLASALVALAALDRLALARGAGSWRQATAWLCEMADRAAAETYVEVSLDAILHGNPGCPSVSSFARGLVLLMDAGLVDPALAPVRACLSHALANLAVRAYASAVVQDRALALLAGMLDEATQIQPGCTGRYLAADDAILSLARDFKFEAIEAVTQRLSEVKELREFTAANDCVFVFTQLMPCFDAGDLHRLQETAVTAASLETSPAIRQYLALQLLAAMHPIPSLLLASSPNIAPSSGLLLVGKTRVALPSDRLDVLLSAGSMNLAPPRDPSTNRDVAVLHGRLVSGNLSARWSLLCCRLATTATSLIEVNARLQDCIDCLQICNGATTSHVSHALTLIWPSVDSDHRGLALDALDVVWTAALDSRRTEAFWPNIQAAVAAAFHPLLVGQAWTRQHLNKPASTMLLSWTWRCLATSSHQRSVRCQLEWLAARLTLANRSTAEHEATNHRPPWLGASHSDSTLQHGVAFHVREDHDEHSQKQENVGPALACSALVVAALVARSSRSEDDLGAGMELALGSLVAQHFNQRLHAQVVFCSLWDVCSGAGFEPLLAQFAAVNATLRAQPLVATGNAQRNVRRLHADFFLTKLDAVEHVSVLSMCRDVPRLTGSPEFLAVEDLLAAGEVGTVQLRCRDEMIHVAPGNPALAEEAIEEVAHGGLQDLDNDEEAEGDVQRKPVPAGADPRHQRESGDVVLVASLIDKPANLGGLCRSCDVFSASLVVPRLTLMQDKAFVGLSVSSQRWVPVSEVRPLDLPSYLADMKCKGYTLVGAEQTAGSIPVQHASFPRKTLLLLGNEKEGVPANLLPLLDMCVEIPQQGVIRSLNVHVTGAIFLWEISRQHHLGIAPQGPDT